MRALIVAGCITVSLSSLQSEMSAQVPPRSEVAAPRWAASWSEVEKRIRSRYIDSAIKDLDDRVVRLRIIWGSNGSGTRMPDIYIYRIHPPSKATKANLELLAIFLNRRGTPLPTLTYDKETAISTLKIKYLGGFEKGIVDVLMIDPRF